MNKQNSRNRRGLKTKALIRKSGKARLVVYRSGVHIYSQILFILIPPSIPIKKLRPSFSFILFNSLIFE